MIHAIYAKRAEHGIELLYPEFPAVDQVPARIDAYMKMVQLVGQRREKTRLSLEVDKHNPILLNIPKDSIIKYNNTVSLKARKLGRHGLRPYFLYSYF